MKINGLANEQLLKNPLLGKIEEGMKVVSIELDYKGLVGVITEIRGEDKESENDSILDIYVDFQVPDDVINGLSEIEAEDATQKYLAENYPWLNGTGIESVIMSEEDLGYYFDGDEKALKIDGTTV